MNGTEMAGSLVLIPLACLALLPLIFFVIHEVLERYDLLANGGAGPLFWAFYLSGGCYPQSEWIILAMLISFVLAVPGFKFSGDAL